MAGRLLSGALSQVALTALRAVSGALVMAMVYATLPQQALGGWLLFASLGAFIMISDLGLSSLAVRALAFVKGARDTGKRVDTDLGSELAAASPADLVRTLRLSYAGLGALAWLLTAAVGWFYLGSDKLDLGPWLGELRFAWLAYSAALAVTMAGSMPNYMLQGCGDLDLEAKLQALGVLGWTVAALLILATGLGPLSLALAYLTQTSAVRWAAARVCRERYPWLWQGGGRFRQPLLKEILVQLGPLVATRLGSLLTFQSGPLLIGQLVGVQAVPPYVAAQTLALYGGQLAAAMPQALLPWVAARRSAGDRDSLRQALGASLRLGLSAQIAWSVMTIAFGATLLRLWLGERGQVEPALLWIFAVLYGLEFHTQVHAQFALGSGHWPFAKASLASGAICAACSVFAIPAWGALGAAASLLVAQLLTSYWYAPWYVMKTLRLAPERFGATVLMPLAFVFGLAMIGAAAGWAASRLGWPVGTLRGLSLKEAGPALLGSAMVFVAVAVAVAVTLGPRGRHDWARRLRGRH